MVSRVFAATPPSVPDDGDGRTKAFGSLARRGFADEHGLARLCRDTSERAGRRRRSHERIRIAREARHARFVAENGAAGPRRGWVNSKNGNLVTLAGQVGAEHVDRGRFAGTRRAGDTETDALAGERQQFLHKLVRGPAVVRALALDQRDRTRQHRAVARADTPNKIGRRQVARSHRILKPWE